MKKIIVSLLLVVMLAAVVLAPCASAAVRAMTLEVSSATAEIGVDSTVRLPINATSSTGYCSGILKIKWDNSALQLIKMEFTSLAPSQGSAEVSGNSGEYTMRVGNSLSRTDFMGTGEFVTPVFKILPSAKAGSYKVEITHTDFLTTDLYDIEMTVKSGTVTLTGEGGASGDPAVDDPDTGNDGDTGKATESADEPGGDPAEADADSDDEVTVPAAVETQQSVTEAAGTPAKSGSSSVIWIIISAVAVIGCVGAAVFVKGRKK